jgi:hypothetical protein
MRFQQYISELAMSADTKMNIINNAKDKYVVKIELRDNISFKFSCVYTSEDTTYYILKKKNLIPKLKKKNLIDTKWEEYAFAWEVYFKDDSGSTQISPKRKGAALELFAALEVAIKEFISKKKPIIFYFSADNDEQSRMKLYRHLAKKIKKAGYKFIEEDIIETQYFVFHKL